MPWSLNTVIGVAGVLAYVVPCGRHYFNASYLILIPVCSSVAGFVVLLGCMLALRYGWGGVARKEVALQDRLAACFFWVPLTYLVYPLKFFRPGLERHPLWLAIALSVVVAVMVARAGSSLFRCRDFAVAYVALAVPLFTAYGLGPNMARAVVELFRL